MTRRALVIVPTYNERANLPMLVAGLMQHERVRVLVVDDHSPDGTGEVADGLAAQYPGCVQVIHRTGQRGFGRSYIDGIAAERSQEPVDVVCQMDADLSHDPRQLPALIAATSEADVVIGSRYVPGGAIVNWPLRRRLLSRFANIYIRDRHAAERARLHNWVPMLAPRRAGGAAVRSLFLGRLLVPGRDAVRSRATRLSDCGSADHVRRAAGRRIKGVARRAARVGDHAVAPHRARTRSEGASVFVLWFRANFQMPRDTGAPPLRV